MHLKNYHKKDMSLCLIETRVLQSQFVQSFHKAVQRIVVSILLIMFNKSLGLSASLYFGDVLRQKTRRSLRFVIIY
jgi:hypothetical protein